MNNKILSHPVIHSVVLMCLFGTAASSQTVDRNFETFPKIDIHVHIYEDTPAYHELMEEINLIKVLNVSVRAMEPERYEYRLNGAKSLANKYPDKFAWACTFPLWNINDSDYIDKTLQGLEQNFMDGALAVKIWKDVGLEVKDEEGEHIHLDDPVFDPIIEYIVVQGKPVLGHLAEPIHAWRPLEEDNPLHRYQLNSPQWHFYGRPEIPSYERIIAARDERVARHPDMTFIAFHLGSMSHDVGMVDSKLAIYPNMYAGVAGRVHFLTRQPSEKVRAFFIKYQDRLLYGTDLSIEEWGNRHPPRNEEEKKQFMEATRRRYEEDWNYFTSSGKVIHRDYETEGLNLPTQVLQKFYYKNAKRIIPGL